MAIDQKEQQIEKDEQILVGGELRPKNAFFVAVAKQEAKNKASGLPDPYPFQLIEVEGEPLSRTILRDRGPY